jgi:hypothetical protein
MEAEPSYEGRELMLLELIRALLALAGRQAKLSMIAPHGGEPLVLRGTLTRPFRQPLDPEAITIGFRLDAITVDVHLRTIADLRRWDLRAAGERAAGVVLVLTDGSVIQIDQEKNATRRNSRPR